MRNINFLKLATLMILSTSLHGCQSISSHGQYVDDDSVAKLESSKLSKQQVVQLLGTPTTVPEYSPNTWYYMQRSLAKRAWFTPKVVSQRIVKIDFNSSDVVEKVDVFQDGQVDDVKLVHEYTKTYGTDLNGVQKFVRNIGRFNKKADSSKKK